MKFWSVQQLLKYILKMVNFEIENVFINWFFNHGILFEFVYVHISFYFLHLWLIFYIWHSWIIFKYILLICKPIILLISFFKLWILSFRWIFLFVFFRYFLTSLQIYFFQFFLLLLIFSLLIIICAVPYKLNSCCHFLAWLYILIFWKIDLAFEFLMIVLA